VLHGGDVVSMEVWKELERFGPPLLGVHGNMDEPALRELLPKERTVEVGGARIGIVHIAGPRAGRAARLRAHFPDANAIVYGHTHIAELARDGDVWILNPGSPTERRRAPRHTMLVLDVEEGRIQPRLVEL
jgi:uncharacterized protein